jgi:hypothetical protein
VSVQILEAEDWIPPMIIILFGPPGTWKTSTLGCAENAIWADFHGSTKTFQRRPRCLWNPITGANKPVGYPDLVDTLRALAADRKLIASLGPRPWLMSDGIDDIEEQYLIPEALRRAEAKTLDENFFKPCNHLLAVHQEFKHELEALTRAGWSLGFTCHAQNIERVNADGVNTLVCDMKLTYISGKLGKWDLSPMWRDWADHCVYLDLEGGKFGKLEKGDKLAKGAGSYTGGRIAYLRGEPWLEAKVRRLDGVPSPQSIKSPDELWALIYGKWAESFDSGALERRRAEVMTLAESVAASIKAPEKLFAAITSAKSTDALTKIAAQINKSKE